MGTIDSMFDVGIDSECEIELGDWYFCNNICPDMGGGLCGDSKCPIVGWESVWKYIILFL